MARQKKIKNVQKEIKIGEVMQDAEVLEAIEQEIDQKRNELEKLKIEISEKKTEITTMAAREISAEEQKLSEKQIARVNHNASLSEKIEKQKAYDNQLVTGRFLNLRNKGQSIKLPYIKHKGDLPKLWNFEDGKVYTIPRGFADQLNGEEVNLPSHYIPKFIKKEEPMDPNMPSSQIAAVDTSNKKFAFVPVGFSN